MVTPKRIIDIHSHILPGVDDGAGDFSDSLRILKWLANQGVTDVIATPHYIDETEYNVSRKKNLSLLKKLFSLTKKEGININLYLGNEIYINDKIDILLDTNKISSLANSEYLLIELPLSGKFPNYQDYFRDLIDRGKKIILAHPERYATFQNKYELIMELADLGVLFQCNIGSILGRYGKKAKKTMRKLAKDKLIFALGSDSHRSGRKAYFNLAIKKLSRYYKNGESEEILAINPAKILKKKA